MSRLDKVLETLEKSNVRITKPRRKILEILEHEKLTIQEIHQRLSEVGMTNLSTVYNNINFLVKQGVVISYNLKGEVSYGYTAEKFCTDETLTDLCPTCKNLIEFNNPKIIAYINNHPKFSKIKIDNEKLMKTSCCINKLNNIKCEYIERSKSKK